MPKEKRSYVTVIHYLNDDGTEMSEEQKTLYLKEKEEIKRKKEEDYEERLKLQEYENSIKGQIEALRKEISIKEKELFNLIDLERLYPDIRKHQGKYTFHQQSKLVNSKATDFESSSYDDEVLIYPYLITEYGKVYSDPFCFTINKFPINDAWKKNLINAGISEQLISLIEDKIEEENEASG